MLDFKADGAESPKAEVPNTTLVAAGQGKLQDREAFVAFNVTLQELDMVQQQFTAHMCAATTFLNDPLLCDHRP